ncbi:unnamed protein product, partial [Effrenium voratum]
GSQRASLRRVGQSCHMDVQEPWRRGSRSAAARPGAARVREAVLEACERMNRPVEESAKVLQYLEAEWLCDPWTLGSMSQEAWQQIKLPLGLKEFLRSRFRSDGDAAALPAASPAGARLPFAMSLPPPSPSPSPAASPQSPSPWRERDPMEGLLERLHTEISRNGRSVQGMARRFKRMDDDRNNYMDVGEFVKAMNELSLNLSEAELQKLWHYLDRDGNGRVTMEQFLRIFKPKLSERRRSLVQQLFSYLDANRNGVIQVDDLKLRCDPGAMAEGVQRARGWRPAPDQVLANFLENFRQVAGGAKAGEVRYPDFERYYEGLSAGIESDQYFQEVLLKAWDLPENFFQAGGGGGIGSGGRSRVPPQHQHHNPTFLDSTQKHGHGHSRGHTGHRLLRSLRRSLAQCCRGGAQLLYGDIVTRTYQPGPRRGDDGPPAQVPKDAFEAAVLRLLPSMEPSDLATLWAVFQDPVRGDCVDYRSFLKHLEAPSHSRQDCAAQLFDELAAGRGVLDLSDRPLPAGARAAFGERSVSRQNWLDFHGLVATAAGETSDSVYEAQLRYLWEKRAPHAHQSAPGYYRGVSRVHLG